MSALLQVAGLGKRFGGFVALTASTSRSPQGERLGLIGPNGSGKSTLVNCICGTLANEAAACASTGRALDGLPAHQRTRRGLARSFQLPRPFVSLTVAENLRVPLLYTVDRARRRRTLAGRRDRGALRGTAALVGLVDQGRQVCRATSRRSTCASSSSPAPWRPSRSC